MNYGLDRRAFLTSSLGLLLAGCAQSKIPGLSSITGSGDAAGNGDITGQSDQFLKFVAYGTKNLLTALSEVGTATGHKEKAAHYAAAAATIKEGSISADEFTKKNDLILDSSFKPEDLQKARSAEGRKHLTNSFIHFTIASFSDKKAAGAGEKLLNAKPSAMELANGTVSGAITVARTAADALPNQVGTATQWLSALRAYMKANNMRIPSAAEAKKVAEEQGMQSSMLADFPTSTTETL
jgi:hypothetical protein